VKNQSNAPICLRISQVMERTGLSRATIERTVKLEHVKSRKIGHAVVLSEDRNEIEPSAESAKEIDVFLP